MRDGRCDQDGGGRGGDVDGCRHVVEICRGKKMFGADPCLVV